MCTSMHSSGLSTITKQPPKDDHQANNFQACNSNSIPSSFTLIILNVQSLLWECPSENPKTAVPTHRHRCDRITPRRRDKVRTKEVPKAQRRLGRVTLHRPGDFGDCNDHQSPCPSNEELKTRRRTWTGPPREPDLEL